MYISTAAIDIDLVTCCVCWWHVLTLMWICQFWMWN